MNTMRALPLTCGVIFTVAACAVYHAQSNSTPTTIGNEAARQYMQTDGNVAERPTCGFVAPPSEVTEIRVHRDGGCSGYYSTAGAKSRGPVYLTGACSGYTLVLRADGSAQYFGLEHVPLIGPHRGEIATQMFQRLARLTDEIGVDKWADRYLSPETKTGWVCVAMDGESPVVVTIKRLKEAKTIEYDPSYNTPIWLRIFTNEVDRVGQSIKWNR